MLNEGQTERYARHLSLPGFGPDAQEKLLNSSVLLVGAGGLGSPAALYLAAAGVGRIGIIDDDLVDLTNLQRQILHWTSSAGMPKAESAKQTLMELNPDIQVDAIHARFDSSNARQLIAGYDLVLDGTDNFPTRYLINDAAVLERKPVVHGSIFLFEGQCTVFEVGRGPCYRCLFPDAPPPGSVPSCAEAGVLGVLPGVIGTLQATETIKILTGIGDPLYGRLLTFDALSMETRNLTIRRNPGCPACGDNPSIHEVSDITWSCTPDHPGMEISLSEFVELHDSDSECLLLDLREPFEMALGVIPGSLHIPLGQLEHRLAEIAPWKTKKVVCICQAGIRSLRAAEFLIKNGFASSTSLAGGYKAWSRIR